jgi:outer membrane beta-barrel protein
MWVTAVVACSVAASVARGEGIPRDQGFMKEPKAVERRIYSLDGKWDIGLFGTFSMKNQLTQYSGVGLNIDRSLGEYFALDLFTSGGIGGLTTLAKDLRNTPATLSGKFDDMAGGGALMATGQLGVRFTPFYGKLSLTSELPVHFHLYFVAGVGGALVDYHQVLGCEADLVGGACPDGVFHHEQKFKLAFNFGGGFRFYITKLISIRAEVRDVMFQDQEYLNVILTKPNTSRSLSGGPATVGLTHTPLVLLGIGFLL